MKKARRRPKNTKQEIKNFKKNEEITATEVRFIDPDSEINEIMPTEKALKLAQDEGLDLIEVSPQANPPVVKLLNYDSFRYQQKKLLKKQKSANKKLEIKGMRLSARIDENDLNTKVKQGIKFLEKGHKVKIDLSLRGRENQHIDIGLNIVKKYIDKIQEKVNIVLEQEAKKTGRVISAIIAKK